MKTTTGGKLLAFVWEHASFKSWDRINRAMRDALRLVVCADMGLSADDFATIYGKFRGGYWMGENDEWVYSLAVAMENKEVIAAYEAVKNRKPFVANDVRIDEGGYLHASSVNRSRGRLVVGAETAIEGKRWHVTGFDDAAGKVRLANYKAGYREGKPDKLRSLTHDQCAELFPAPKKTKKIVHPDGLLSHDPTPPSREERGA